MTNLLQTTEEIWEYILGDQRYMVSNIGRIKSLRKNREKVLSKCYNKGGYHTFSYWLKGKMQTLLVHRLVAMAFIPNPLNKPFINHKNGIKSDNSIENLEWCTGAENNLHACITGLKIAAKGSANGNSNLTEKDVAEIKYLINEQMPGKQIAREYNVTKFAVYAIKVGLSWKHIKANSSMLF